MAHRDFPSQVGCVNGLILVIPTPDFEDYTRQVFSQIRQAGATDANLIHSILEMIEKIVETDPPLPRLEPFRKQLQEAEQGLDKITNPIEQSRLRERLNAILNGFPKIPVPEQPTNDPV